MFDWLLKAYEAAKATKYKWLIVLCLVYPVLLVVRGLRADPSYQSAAKDPLFLGTAGALFVIAAIVALVDRKQKKKPIRWVAGSVLTLGAVTCFVVGYFLDQPKPLPSNKLVVDVLSFIPASSDEAAKVEADNFTDRVYEALKHLQESGAPIVVKGKYPAPSGSTEDEREENARLLGFTREGSAHLVIWGKLRRDHEQIFIRPYVKVAQAFEPTLSNRGPETVEFVPQRPQFELRSLTFKEQSAKDLGNFIETLHGLAFYHLGKWSDAIDVFKHVTTPECNLLRARSLYRLSQSSIDAKGRSDLLRQSVAAYRAGPSSISPPQESALAEADYASAMFDKGNAFADAADVESEPTRGQLYQEADDILSRFAKATQAKDPLLYLKATIAQALVIAEKGSRNQVASCRDDALAELDRAALLSSQQASRADLLATININRLAVITMYFESVQEKDFDRILGVARLAGTGAENYYRNRDQGTYRALVGNLGVLYGKATSFVPPPKRKPLFAEAYRLFQVEERLVSPERDIEAWTKHEVDYAILLHQYGLYQGGDSGRRMILMAADKYAELEKHYPQARFPSRFADMENNLSSVWGALGDVNVFDAMDAFRKSGDTAKAAWKERTKEDPFKAAESAFNIGHAETRLSTLNGDLGMLKEGIHFLSLASDYYEAHHIQNREYSTAHILAQAQSDLALRFDPTNRQAAIDVVFTLKKALSFAPEFERAKIQAEIQAAQKVVESRR